MIETSDISINSPGALSVAPPTVTGSVATSKKLSEPDTHRSRHPLPPSIHTHRHGNSGSRRKGKHAWGATGALQALAVTVFGMLWACVRARR